MGLQNTIIDVSSLEAGQYVLKIQTDVQMQAMRLLIAK